MPSPFVTLRHADAVRVGMVVDDTIRLRPPQVDDLVGLVAGSPAALPKARRQCASPGV